MSRQRHPHPRHSRPLPELPAGDQCLRAVTVNGAQASSAVLALLAQEPAARKAEGLAFLAMAEKLRSDTDTAYAAAREDGITVAIPTARTRRRERRGYLSPANLSGEANR